MTELSSVFGSTIVPQPNSDTFLWGTVTSISPVAVTIDGDSAAIAAPTLLVSSIAVNDRVWCQFRNRRLVVIGRAGGQVPASGTLIRIGSGVRTTGTSYSATEFNVCTVTLPQAYTKAGLRFRITGQVNIQSNTNGAFSDLILKHGQNASIGGTTITAAYQDHTAVAGRTEAQTVIGEWVYDDVENVNNMNVVMTVSPSAQSSITCSTTRPGWLFVDLVAS